MHGRAENTIECRAVHDIAWDGYTLIPDFASCVAAWLAAAVPPARPTRCFGVVTPLARLWGGVLVGRTRAPRFPRCGKSTYARARPRFRFGAIASLWVAMPDKRRVPVKSRRMISVLVLGRAWLAFNVANPPPPRRRNRPLAPSQDFPHVICILSKSWGYAPFCSSFSHRSWGQTPFLF